MTDPNRPEITEAAQAALGAYMSEHAAAIMKRAAEIATEEGRAVVTVEDVISALPSVDDEFPQRKLRSEVLLASARRLELANMLGNLSGLLGVASALFLIVALFFQFRNSLNPPAMIALTGAAVGAFTAWYAYTLSRLYKRKYDRSRRRVQDLELRLVENLGQKVSERRGGISDADISKWLLGEFLDGWSRLEQSLYLTVDMQADENRGGQRGLRNAVLDLAATGSISSSDAEKFLELLRLRNMLVHNRPESTDIDPNTLRGAIVETDRLTELLIGVLEGSGGGRD